MVLLALNFVSACGTSAQRESAEGPGFSAAVTPQFVLSSLRRMTGLGNLEAGPAEAAGPEGYSFVLPEAGKADGEAFVVMVDFHVHEPSSVNAEEPGLASALSEHASDTGTCMRDLRDLPFSAGVGGSTRAVKFTTGDSRYDVEISVFEKLGDTTADHSLDLHLFARLISERYCEATGTSSPTTGAQE